jgi:glycosyltransferase involved in cell wall biosynthesis
MNTINKKFDVDFKNQSSEISVIAIIAAHNEDDVIYHVIEDLIKQGVFVYLIDHCSTDNTIQEASKWLGKGLIHIEHFPEDAGYSKANKTRYIWKDMLKRKEELALNLNTDWFINHDADEFRESPWPALSLHAAIKVVDNLGYNAIDFELLNFRPIDNLFEPGTDVRNSLKYFERSEDFNKIQIKAWKKQYTRVDLQSSGGHEVMFEGRKVFPVKFVLRHYPIRSQLHGKKKVFQERKNRYIQHELNCGWHQQYNEITENHNFLSDKAKLTLFDENVIRVEILSSALDAIIPASIWEKSGRDIEKKIIRLENELQSIYSSRGWRILEAYYVIKDWMLWKKKKLFGRFRKTM